MRRRGRLAAVTAGAACVAAAALVAVSASAAPSVASSAPAADQADWTLMIYDVADTQNIADDLISNLAALAALPDMPNVHVVALVDMPEQGSPDYPHATLPGVAPFSTAKLLELGGHKWNEVHDYGELSMGRPDSLATFIKDVGTNYPADKYGLILSDHGAGAAGGYYDEDPTPSHLSIAGMREGIIDGLQAAGIDRLDLIDHDACLMANYEVSSALAPLTDVLSASEEVTFSNRTITPDAVAALAQDITAEQWATMNNAAYAQYADQNRQGWGTFTATSVIDSDKLPLLDAAIQSFADAASAHMSEIAPEVGRARTEALEFLIDLDPTHSSFDLVDLGDFMAHLQDVPDDVAVARDAVVAALKGVVLDQQTRQASQQATGLNVFFPQSSGFAQTYVDQHVGPPGWEEFVSSYLQASGAATGDSSKSATFVSDQATVLHQGADGILIAGQLGDGQSANVTDTQTQVYAELGGSRALAIALPGYLDAGGQDQVQGAWSYQVTAIGNGGGGRGLPVSSFYQAQSGGLIGNFYAAYTNAAGETSDVQFKLLISSEGEVQGVTVSQMGSGGSASITLDGGSLTPYFIVPGADGYQLSPSDQSVKVTPDFQISFPSLRPGTPFDMGVVVTDVGGDSDGAQVSAQVTGGGGQGRSSLRIGG